MAEAIAGATVLVLGLVFGFIRRRDRREGELAVARVEIADDAANEAERAARAALAPPLSGADSLDVLDRLSGD